MMNLMDIMNEVHHVCIENERDVNEGQMGPANMESILPGTVSRNTNGLNYRWHSCMFTPS